MSHTPPTQYTQPVPPWRVQEYHRQFVEPEIGYWKLGLAISFFFLTGIFLLFLFAAIAMFILFFYDCHKVSSWRERARYHQQQWARYYQQRD